MANPSSHDALLADGNGNALLADRQANVVDLTDSSGGTASDTLADVTEVQNAGSADRVPTENAIASLAAKIAALNAIMEAHGLSADS